MTDNARLYLLTPPAFDPATFRDVLTAVLDAGNVACLQLRLKDATDDDIRRAADMLRPVAQDRGVAFLMNGRPDLAVETGCDGVHIGQGNPDYREARRIVGADATVGVACGDSRHLAMVAAEQGADYVAFGPFFPSRTKPAETFAPPDILDWWSALMEVPCVAIGGITPENCPALGKADFIAAIAAMWDHADGPAAAVKAFNRAIAEIA